MLKRILLGAVAAAFIISPVAAQDAAQGQQLYEDNCSGCHQSGGGGVPPDFPALAGNQNLSDLNLIVTNIHRGKGAMPAFPDLTSEEIAAIGSYIRNTWGNSFGEVTTEEVDTIIAGLSANAGAQLSVWDGVYSEEQAARGMAVHSAVCAKCHGVRGNGANEPDQPKSPPIARQAFIRNWDGQTLATLFEYVKTTMPPDNPGSRSDQEYIDAVAQILALSGMPAGDSELVAGSPDLANIVIGAKPE